MYDHDPSLAQALADTFRQLDTLAERHHQALAYQAAQERLNFLHEQVRALQTELVALRSACTHPSQNLGDASGEAIWQRTLAELAREAPAALASPGRALVTGDLDLLHLVAYLGGALTLTRERRTQLGETPEGPFYSPRTPGTNGGAISDSRSIQGDQLQVIAQIAQPGTADGSQASYGDHDASEDIAANSRAR